MGQYEWNVEHSCCQSRAHNRRFNRLGHDEIKSEGFVLLELFAGMDQELWLGVNKAVACIGLTIEQDSERLVLVLIDSEILVDRDGLKFVSAFQASQMHSGWMDHDHWRFAYLSSNVPRRC